MTTIPATVLLLLSLTPAAEGALAGHPEVEPRLALFETWIERQMAYRHQPGVVAGIVFGGELVWARGFGSSDLERGRAAAPETLFRIGSVTKLFTATAILQLRDRGKLRLDDPVKRILPWFTYRERFPEAPEITLRHLLTHTSGLPREADLPYWTDRRFPTRESLIEALAGQENVFAPGSRYKYSNLGMALLGEVVEAASGTSYEDYVRRNVLEPAGMTSTRVRYQDVGAGKLATGYLVSRGDGVRPVAPATDSNALTPAADISSNLVDLARFVSAHLYEGPAAEAPLLSPSTLADMHRVHWLSPSWESGRGLGFGVWRQGERTLVGHAGWVAGYRSQVAFDPESRFGVIVLTNSDEGGPGTYLREAFDFVVPAMEKAARPKPEAADAAQLERYAGAYHNPWGEVTDVVAVNGRLMMAGRGYPPRGSLAGAFTELVAESEHTFRRPDTGAMVAFELSPDGRVARVKDGANYLFPEDCGTLDGNLHCTWE